MTTRNAAYGMAELEKESSAWRLTARPGRESSAHRPERLRSAQSHDRRSALERLDDIGFFQLVNHGIPQAQIDEAFADDGALLRASA